jgi:hypothetical protein
MMLMPIIMIRFESFNFANIGSPRQAATGKAGGLKEFEPFKAVENLGPPNGKPERRHPKKEGGTGYFFIIMFCWSIIPCIISCIICILFSMVLMHCSIIMP